MSEEFGDLFAQPEPEPQPVDLPSFVDYERHLSSVVPQKINLRLVGKNPLWGHLLWNAGKVSAEYIDEHSKELEGKTVLELGAASALPSLLASLSAQNVVATDYPDPDLLENIECNIKTLKKDAGRELPICAQGYIWGNETQALLNAPGQNGRKFDFIILSDVVFNHTEHEKLIRTCKETLAPAGQVLVVFTPHRPKLFEKDLAFFSLAEDNGFVCEKLFEKELKPMFEEDEESVHIRSMVFAHLLHW
ncbi:Protein N-methyltransferase NNT1 [Wickerhamiella sorbophila]|uniref:Protein N-methyltransferase NNT1 n=1 Tax=Wickerhamiella sorbophila TaxID=45607 RepID=A0A2T0FL09_9ASCO|nr:Protein N-methyltransferase NNT1 [Wickerhamiella sorbophila]PRT55676.1 Protein N-methyltransferase NNT1 [Wickerhamiella sorbophila]